MLKLIKMRKGNFMNYFLDAVSGKDMTKDICDMLSKYGACYLSGGDYLVSGIDMPDGSSIIGIGASSRLVLAEGDNAYAVKLGSFCTVKNLSIAGSLEKIELPEAVGSRHGILFEGNAAATEDYANQPKHSIVEDCFIFSFTGGGITCNDTGYSIRSAITASNCHIFNCGAGINVSCFSEYHKFTNIISTENLYGCINNGGNNVFVNCGFDCNGTGFLIDNSRKQSNNQAHGSAIGCTFNHSGNNSGIGIQILGANWGYVFEGGQVFYSKIVLENSTNISFTSFNFGGKKINEIDISGGNLTTFANCAFHFKPKFNVNDNDKVKISNCFTRDGEPVTL
jgi:hypothetical protein